MKVFLVQKNETSSLFAPLIVGKQKVRFLKSPYITQKYRKLINENINRLSIPERLAFYRNNCGYTQEQIAQLLNMTKYQYSKYEYTIKDKYNVSFINSILKIYNILPEDLLDEYNLFLYHGQGAQLEQHRKSLGLNVQEYADYLDVPYRHLTLWIKDKNRMGKGTFEKIAKKINRY